MKKKKNIIQVNENEPEVLRHSEFMPALTMLSMIDYLDKKKDTREMLLAEVEKDQIEQDLEIEPNYKIKPV